MIAAGQSPNERLRPIYQEMAAELRRRASWLLFILDPPSRQLSPPAQGNLDGYTDAELRFLAAADLVTTALSLRLFFAAGAFLFAVNTALSLFGSRGVGVRDWALLAIELSLVLFFSYGLWRTPADRIALLASGDPAAAPSPALERRIARLTVSHTANP